MIECFDRMFYLKITGPFYIRRVDGSDRHRAKPELQRLKCGSPLPEAENARDHNM